MKNKKILISGGYGAIGYSLLRLIRASNVDKQFIVASYDPLMNGDFDFEIDVIKESYDEKFTRQQLEDAVEWSDIIIHLGEDTIPNDPIESIAHNVGMTSVLLLKSAIAGKRTVVPCWKEFSNDRIPTSPWEFSLHWRAELASMFQSGNSVISPLFLPRVISPFHHSKTWGNLVKRFYNAAAFGRVAEIYPGELDDKAEWMWIGAASIAILNETQQRSRARKFAVGEIASTESIAEFIADKMEVEFIEVLEPKDKMRRRAYANKDSLKSVTIAASIEKCIEIWEVDSFESRNDARL